MPPSSTGSPDRRGLLIVVSGPSGVGKSTVVEALAAERDFEFSVSATTRSRRPTEQDGVHYHFLDEAGFRRMIEDGELLEWAEYAGNLYGTPRGPVEAAMAAGRDVLLDIENDGARQVKANLPEAVLIFILPPSREELERRLRGRADTGEDDIQRRLAAADEQIAEARRHWDWLVTNDDVASVKRQIDRILSASESTPSATSTSTTSSRTVAVASTRWCWQPDGPARSTPTSTSSARASVSDNVPFTHSSRSRPP